MSFMRTLFLTTALATASAACSSASAPEEAEAGTDATTMRQAEAGIAIDGPWIRQPPPGGQVAAGYLEIVNHGAADDRLLSVETAAAGHVEVHEILDEDGIARMRRIDGGLEVPAGGRVTLVPGGYHLMLMQPDPGLAAGQRVDAILSFERAGPVETSFEVRTPGGESAHGHDGDTAHGSPAEHPHENDHAH